MTVKFLSEEWAQGLKQKLNADPKFQAGAKDKSARVQQVITRPEGDINYWVLLSDGEVDFGVGMIDEADATVTQSYETAAGMAQGKVNPVTAFMLGKIRVTGNVAQLMALQSVLGSVPAALADMDVEY